MDTVQKAFSIVGHSVPRVDGVDKVTGKAKYTGDLTIPGTIEMVGAKGAPKPKLYDNSIIDRLVHEGFTDRLCFGRLPYSLCRPPTWAAILVCHLRCSNSCLVWFYFFPRFGCYGDNASR